MHRRLILALAAALSACSGVTGEAQREAPDPVTLAALSDPLMIDPDLTSQSHASAALGGGGPAQAEIPRAPTGPDWIGQARADAEKIVGSRLSPVGPLGEREPMSDLLTPVAFAGQLPGARACVASAGYGFVWAAALPASFPVYPRGHAQVAAGSDLGGCKLRAVRFTSPVPPEELASFYLALGKSAGLALDYRRAGAALVLAGSKGKATVLIRIAPGEDGLATVDLATSQI